MFTQLQAYLNEPFIQRALLSAIPLGLLSGILGTLLVARRLLYVAGSLAHTCFGGIALGLLLNQQLPATWSATLNFPFLGALSVALSAAVVIAVLSARESPKLDTVLSLFWASGIAGGIIFLTKTQQLGASLSALLFGELFLITNTQLLLITAVLIASIGFILLSYRQLQLSFIERNYAILRKVPTKRLHLGLLLLCACAIVTLIQAVGITLIIALFALGAATALLFARSLFSAMVYASLLNIFYIGFGIFFSVWSDIPAAPAVIAIAVGGTLIGECWKSWLSR